MEILTEKIMFTPMMKAALKAAEESPYHKERIGAVIFKGTRIHVTAHNSIRANKVPYKFKAFVESLHAECHAIIKARKNLKGYSILVVRLGKSGKLRLARPCDFCYDFIRYVGIKEIYYSDNDENIIKEEVQ